MASLDHLARLHYQEGRVQDAEALIKESLAIRETALGEGHPDLLQNLDDYASLMRATGRPDEALRLEARARAIRASQEASR